MNYRFYFRNILINWQGNFISIAGLSTGMMVAILSLSYIIFESSFDSFHSRAKSIFTVYTKIKVSGSDAISFACESGMKEYAVSNIADVENACITKRVKSIITLNKNNYKDIEGYYTDSDFFSLFDFRLLSGDSRTLSEPGNIFLTERLAKKLFGKVGCFGKQIYVDKKSYIVSGIIEDPPFNSNLNFDFLLPVANELNTTGTQKGSDMVNLYILTRTRYKDPAIIGRMLDGYFDSTGKVNERSEVIPLRKLHQYTWKTADSFLIFISISLLVLFISLVNYINAFLSGFEARGKEIAMRKVNGASGNIIARMIIAEIMLTTIIASILGFILSVLFLEYFQKLTSIRLQLYGPGLWKIQVLVITLTLLSGLLSGIIIATRIKGTSLADIIKGRIKFQGSKTRKIFIGLQFGISGGLLCIMVIIFLQVKFLENINMGFDTSNRLLIKLSPVMANKYEMIRSELQKYPGIKMITGRGSTFGNVDMAMTASGDNNSPETRVFVFGYNVEDDFFKTYGIKLLEGKTFSDFSGTDSTLIMLDKYTAGILGLEHPVGSKIKARSMTLEVIGLVADADFISLASNRMPRLYTQFSKRCSELTIMYDGDERAVLTKIGKFLAQLDPDYIFTPEKLSDAVRGLYKKEVNLIDIISICGIIAVLLSLSGIYAVAQLFARNNIRQNSIRKIFGASENIILIHSLLEIVWPVIAGSLISWPVAYLITKQWLTNFGMKINISPLPFFSTLVILLVFVLVTIYSVTHKFALKDPAEILRLE